MKKGISYILIGIYLLAAFQFSLPFLSYYANYHYFATEACVNRHNPDMKCNGQCQLSKMVKNQHDASKTDKGIQVEKPYSSTIFFYEEANILTVALRSSALNTASQTELFAPPFYSPPTPPPRFG